MEATENRQVTPLARDRVADEEVGAVILVNGHDQEAVAGAHRTEVRIDKAGERLDLGGGGPVVEGDDVLVTIDTVFGAGEEREGWHNMYLAYIMR
jgi:hypothetical protein